MWSSFLLLVSSLFQFRKRKNLTHLLLFFLIFACIVKFLLWISLEKSKIQTLLSSKSNVQVKTKLESYLDHFLFPPSFLWHTIELGRPFLQLHGCFFFSLFNSQKNPLQDALFFLNKVKLVFFQRELWQLQYLETKFVSYFHV